MHVTHMTYQIRGCIHVHVFMYNSFCWRLLWPVVFLRTALFFCFCFCLRAGVLYSCILGIHSPILINCCYMYIFVKFFFTHYVDWVLQLYSIFFFFLKDNSFDIFQRRYVHLGHLHVQLSYILHVTVYQERQQLSCRMCIFILYQGKW